MSLISLFYGSKVVYHFIHHRITFMTYLNTCPSSISVSRYIRLMALSSVEVFWELAANIYVLYFNLKLNGLPAYRNWAWVHFDFNRIDRNPRFLVPDNVFEAFLITWWIIPSACFAFFLFFGAGEEAMEDYRNVINWVRVHIFRQTIIPKSTHSQFGSLPSQYVFPSSIVLHPADFLYLLTLSTAVPARLILSFLPSTMTTPPRNRGTISRSRFPTFLNRLPVFPPLLLRIIQTPPSKRHLLRLQSHPLNQSRLIYRSTIAAGS